MKTLYSTLIATVAFVVFASLVIADPGTTWENQINGPARFQVLNQFGGAAVFDRETGRVWERSPGNTDGDRDVDDNDKVTWFTALSHCYQLEVGGRKGWRLPTIEELASLVDASQANPALPAGQPFSDVQSSLYWSATTNAVDTSFAWGVDFLGGRVDVVSGKIGSLFAWCVRGGQGIDGVQ